MLSRLALNSIVRVTRTSPTIRTVVPFRWVSELSYHSSTLYFLFILGIIEIDW